MGAFVDSVNECPSISGYLQRGLQAMGADSKLVAVSDSRKINGSVDIDTALKCSCPHDARWDYVIGYEDKAYFVEVHPADTGNVTEMVAKVIWLKKWLAHEGAPLAKIRASNMFHWIPSGRVKILPNSTHAKKIAKHNLLIHSKLTIL